MPFYMEESASIAASATNDNCVSGQEYERSSNSRTLRSIGAAVLDNAPANEDLIVEVFIGSVPVAEFRAGLVRTTGMEIQAEDHIPINLPIPAGQQLRVKARNQDAASAHALLYALAIDGF